MVNKNIKVKVIYTSKNWDCKAFEKEIEHYIRKGYTPKYESFQVTSNGSGGPGHYFILMEKKMKTQ